MPINITIENNFLVLTDTVTGEEVFSEPKAESKVYIYSGQTFGFETKAAGKQRYGNSPISYPFVELTSAEVTYPFTELTCAEVVPFTFANLKTYLRTELSGSASGAVVAGADGLDGVDGQDGTLINGKKLNADFPAVAQTTTTRADVTGLSFPIVAGKSYEIRFIGMYSAPVATTGGSIGFVLPSGSGQILGDIEMDIAQTIGATGLKLPIFAISNLGTLTGSFGTSTGVGVINQPHGVKADLVFHCATTGVFQVQWGTEVANSFAKLLGGSSLVWNEIILV